MAIKEFAITFTSEMAKTTTPYTNKLVVGYAPELSKSLTNNGVKGYIAAANKAGYQIFTTETDLLEFLSNH